MRLGQEGTQAAAKAEVLTSEAGAQLTEAFQCGSDHGAGGRHRGVRGGSPLDF